MGCTQSKIENEETVNRCKERKQHIQRAVTARNKFAAAHYGHAMSLKNTGAALSDFAQGEVVQPSPSPLPDDLHRLQRPAPPPPPLLPNDLLPPPPLPHMTLTDAPPLQRSVTMPEFSIPRPDNKHSEPIIEEENEEDVEAESSHSLKRRSSRSRGSRGGGAPVDIIPDEILHPPHKPEHRRSVEHQQQPPPPPPEGKEMWDFFFHENIAGPTLAPEENSIEREEMERKMLEERARMMERKKSEKVEVIPEAVKPVNELPPQPPAPAEVAAKVVKRVRAEVPPDGKKKGGGSSVNLVQIFTELDECFLKASQSAHDVSRMLEATRLHYHSNFADKRGHINHSERVMRVITWNRSFRGLQQNHDDGVDNRLWFGGE